MTMTVAVTGGAGFIGSALVRNLVQDPSIGDVVVVDNFSTGSRRNLYGVDVNVQAADVRDRDALSRALRPADAIVHLAALPSVVRSLQDPLSSHEVNVTGTFNVLEQSRALDIPIYAASSSSVYGASQQLPKREDQTPEPMSPYAAGKLAGEAYLRAYRYSFDVRGIAFRFFNVYGPRQPFAGAYSAVVRAFLSAARDGVPFQVYGDGRQTRDFTFVDSVADALAASVVRGLDYPEPVNLAFGTRTSILELGEAVSSVTGTSVGLIFKDARKSDVRDSQADGGSLKELLPDIRPVSLIEGLQYTYDHLARETKPEIFV